MTDDELDALLHVATPPLSPQLELHILRRTSWIVHGRVWRRRVTTIFVLAAAFALGAGSALLVRPTPLRTLESTVMLAPAPAPAVPMLTTLSELELQAEQADNDERARLYFVAGKRYAQERGDWDSALRCYKQALDAAPLAAEQIDPKTDDWLLMSLKIERQKE